MRCWIISKISDMPESSPPDVCVVTQPARRQTGKTHAHQLLDILGAITAVSMLTANLDPDSPVRDDHEVVELTREGTGDLVPVAAYRFLRNQVLMTRAIARRDEGVILFFGTTAYLLPIVAACAVGKTVVVEPRGDVPLSLRLKWEEQLTPRLARALSGLVSVLEHAGYTAAHAIVTYTPSMAEELGLGRYDHKLHTNGARYVDTDRFAPTMPLEERPVAVGYLGRLDVEKDVPTLVEVAERLPDVIQFRFVGDGDYRDAVERNLAEEIEAGQVDVTGWVDHDEVPRELNRMRLLLLVSEPTEGLPTAILEAFACGTPVYATPVSGVPDVVREGETGYLMTSRDPDTVVERITDAVESDTLVPMSSACRTTAEKEFSFDAAVERYRTILQSVGNCARL
jgi:glycosyltransferase involved in cell wall biosynthesis